MSPSGPSVITYCSRALAPGRTGCVSARRLLSSSHSWVNHFTMVLLCSRWSHRCRSTGDRFSHAVEQVILDALDRDPGVGEDEGVVAVKFELDLVGKPEPAHRGRVDLRRVREECEPPHVAEAGEIDERRGLRLGILGAVVEATLGDALRVR